MPFTSHHKARKLRTEPIADSFDAFKRVAKV